MKKPNIYSSKNIANALKAMACSIFAVNSMNVYAAVDISRFETSLAFDSTSQSYILDTLADDFNLSWSSDGQYCYLYRNSDSTTRQRSANAVLYIARDFEVSNPSMTLVCASGDSSSPSDVDPDNSDTATINFILREDMEQGGAMAINSFTSTLPYDEESGAYQLESLESDVELSWSSNANYCYLYRNSEVTSTQRGGSGSVTARRDFAITNPTMTLKCANTGSENSESLSGSDSVSSTLNFTVVDGNEADEVINVEANTKVVTPVVDVPIGASTGLNNAQAFFEPGMKTSLIEVNGVQVEYTTNVLDKGLDVDTNFNRQAEVDVFNTTFNQLGSGSTVIASLEFLIIGDPVTGDSPIVFSSQNGNLITVSEDPVSLEDNFDGSWTMTVTMDQQNSLPVTADSPLVESFSITGISTDNLTYVKTTDSEGFDYERLRPSADLSEYFNENTIGEIIFYIVAPTLERDTRAIFQYFGTRPFFTDMTKIYSNIAYEGTLTISVNGEVIATTTAEAHPTEAGVYSYDIADGVVLTGLPQSIEISVENQQPFLISGYQSKNVVNGETTDYFGTLP